MAQERGLDRQYLVMKGPDERLIQFLEKADTLPFCSLRYQKGISFQIAGLFAGMKI